MSDTSNTTPSAPAANGTGTLPKADFSNLFDSGMETLLNGEGPVAEPENGEVNPEGDELAPSTEEPKETPAKTEEETSDESEEKDEKDQEEGLLGDLETLTLGDNTYEIPSGAELTFVVDGKPEKLTIQEIKKQFSGKVSYERKFQDLAENRKRFLSDVQRVDTKIKNLFALATSDPEAALLELVRMRGGATPEQAVAQVMKAIENSQNEWGNMTEEQRNLRIKEKTLLAKERALKTKEEQEAALKEQITTESYIMKAIQEEGISVDEFKAGWKEIERLVSDGSVDLSGKSHKELADITLGYIESNKIYGRIENAIRSIDASKVSDKGLIQEIRAKIDSDFTEEDIADILREGYGLGSNSKNPKKESSSLTQKAPQKKKEPKAEIAEDKLAWVDDLLTSPF